MHATPTRLQVEVSCCLITWAGPGAQTRGMLSRALHPRDQSLPAEPISTWTTPTYLDAPPGFLRKCLPCLVIIKSCYSGYRINKPFTCSRCKATRSENLIPWIAKKIEKTSFMNWSWWGWGTLGSEVQLTFPALALQILCSALSGRLVHSNQLHWYYDVYMIRIIFHLDALILSSVQLVRQRILQGQVFYRK